MRMLRLVPVILLSLGLSLSVTGPSQAEGTGAPVDLIQIKGLIDPIQVDYLIDRLAKASTDGAQAVIIEIDTPGGLDVDIEAVIDAVEDAAVPVLCWVAPREANAAGVGTYIVSFCDQTYMATDSSLGPTHPVNLALPGAPHAVPMNVAGNPIPLFIVASDSVLSTETAVGENHVAGEASTLDSLLEQLDGQEFAEGVTLETFDESTGSLSATVRFQGMGLPDRIKHTVVNPDIAYLLLLAGLFGLIFELYNPGIGLAAILGAVALVLAFYGLNTLPTTWFAVLLVVVGIGGFLLDLQIGALGFFTIAGAAGIAAGGGLMFKGAAPELLVGPWTIVAGLAFTLLFFVSVMTAALRVRLRRPVTAADSPVGTVGEAKTDIAPEGTVITKGALWRARTMETGIAAGSKVKIMATEGLVLLVEPMHGHETEDEQDEARHRE